MKLTLSEKAVLLEALRDYNPSWEKSMGNSRLGKQFDKEALITKVEKLTATQPTK